MTIETIHQMFFKNSTDMCEIESDTIDLIITSPPYPMIEMWDILFSSLNEEIQYALQEEKGTNVFNLMHEELDQVWKESARVLKTGGIVCINIGDATRKISENFQLFPNHVRITEFFQKNGFSVLPYILWRKPTNSPNKFLGSGMLPPNAYITLEHEYILIFRKGDNKRKITPKSEDRYNSAYFWEERNKWFSDIWDDIRGVSQSLNNNKNSKLRERSAAFPLELPYRLINMFSIYGDMVLDPFWGTGTTSLAAIISARNSIGYEINSEFMELFRKNVRKIKQLVKSINTERLNQHTEFVIRYKKKGRSVNYNSINYKFPVITQQEKNLLLYSISNYYEKENKFIVNHKRFEYNHKRNLVQSDFIS
ncbi:MAG: DNA-methyltransferase [Promethearchaeota archaeon]